MWLLEVKSWRESYRDGFFGAYRTVGGVADRHTVLVRSELEDFFHRVNTEHTAVGDLRVLA